MQSTMVVISLKHPQELHFLQHILNESLRAGLLNSTDLPVAAAVYADLLSSQEIPLATSPNLGRASSVELGPNGVALEFGANTEPGQDRVSV